MQRILCQATTANIWGSDLYTPQPDTRLTADASATSVEYEKKRCHICFTSNVRALHVRKMTIRHEQRVSLRHTSLRRLFRGV